LRKFENQIVSNELSQRLHSVIYKQITIYELGAGAREHEDEKASKRLTDVHAAIGTLVGKLTILEDLTPELMAKYKDLPLEQVEIYERIFFFVRKNCNGELRELLEEACFIIDHYTESFFAEEEFVRTARNFH